MFSRPHLRVTESHVDLAVSLDAVRQLESFTQFFSALETEVKDVYGKGIGITSELWYAVDDSADPVFANHWTERVFDLIKTYDDSHAQALVLRKEYEDMLAARPAPIIPEPKFDENGEEIPPPPKSKKAQREEAEQKKRDAEQLRVVLTMEHKAHCAAIKLKNAFNLKCLRVGIVRE